MHGKFIKNTGLWLIYENITASEIFVFKAFSLEPSNP